MRKDWFGGLSWIFFLVSCRKKHITLSNKPNYNLVAKKKETKYIDLQPLNASSSSSMIFGRELLHCPWSWEKFSFILVELKKCWNIIFYTSSKPHTIMRISILHKHIALLTFIWKRKLLYKMMYLYTCNCAIKYNGVYVYSIHILLWTEKEGVALLLIWITSISGKLQNSSNLQIPQ